MLTAKWVGRIFWDDSEKRRFEHILELIFGQTNPTFRASGTSLVTTRWARPSTMAVLPTPGSPTSKRRHRGTGDRRFFVASSGPWNKNQSNRYMDKTPSYQLLDTRFILLTSIFLMCYILFDYWIPSLHPNWTEAPGWDYSSFFGPKPWIPMRVLEGDLVGEILGSL